jgi:hypothetical protein
MKVHEHRLCGPQIDKCTKVRVATKFLGVFLQYFVANAVKRTWLRKV